MAEDRREYGLEWVIVRKNELCTEYDLILPPSLQAGLMTTATSIIREPESQAHTTQYKFGISNLIDYFTGKKDKF
jgi:hypothetical protein